MIINLKKVDEIIDRYGDDATAQINMLQEINSVFRYLPREALERVAEKTAVPLSRLFGMATFYKSFNLLPRGRHEICICTGTACHVRGATSILDRAEQTLKIKAGETTPDGRFTLETVNCLGACALGPLVTVDGQYHGKLTAVKLKKLLGRSSDAEIS